MDYFRKNSNRGVEDMEFPKDIEKKTRKEKKSEQEKKNCEISKGLGPWKFQWV